MPRPLTKKTLSSRKWPFSTQEEISFGLELQSMAKASGHLL